MKHPWLVMAACLVAMFAARAAPAHPAGFTSINRYIGVDCDAQGRVHIAYLLDFAEMPSYAEIDLLDTNADGAVSPEEQRAYLDRRVPALVADWAIDVNGVKAIPHVTGNSLEIRDGERGLSTVRIAADVTVERAEPPEPGTREIHVSVRDRTFSGHSGWREMAAQDSAGSVVASGFKEAPSDALSYTTGETKPPRVDEAQWTFRLMAGLPVPAAAARPSPPAFIDERLGRLSTAMKQASGSWWFSAVALGLAVALGAAHALSPGHGKALAAAYLVGHRARPSQAVVFGTTVTVAHTFVVFLVGGLAVTIERTLGSDRMMRGLELASALTIVALGLVQLSARWREATNREGNQGHTHAGDAGRGVRSVVALGVSSGLTPCPSALALLFAAIALHRFGFGLVLVLAFSVGVASTLTVTGLLVVLARRLLDRASKAGVVLRWLPVLSSACVLVIGVLLCASAWSASSP